jgi:hypothetical protein
MEHRFGTIQQYCSCTTEFGDYTRLAITQQDYTVFRQNHGHDFATTMTEMGIKRICCRMNYMNLIYLFLNNDQRYRITDETGFIRPGLGKKIQLVEISGPEIKPSRPFPTY